VVGTYLIRRLAQTLPVLVLASIVVFVFLRLVPGDPALILAGPDATPEIVAAIREQMGLNASWPQQYLIWIGHVLQGDLGRSYITRLPIAQLIATAMPATIELALAALFLAVVIGIPSGIISAVWHQRPIDWLITSVNGLVLAVPNFWIAILLIIAFSVRLRWLPPGGRVDFADDPGAAWKSLVLPAITLFPSISAALSRFTRAAMLEVLHEDYVRTARAKGLAPYAVIARHGLRNALIPVITILGIQFGRLMGGAVIIENVFAWPGVGRLILQGVLNRDYAVVQGALLLLVTVFIVVNLLVDLLYGVCDPRVRLAVGRR
jgi:peptide/nickel transport system permease protein